MRNRSSARSLVAAVVLIAAGCGADAPASPTTASSSVPLSTTSSTTLPATTTSIPVVPTTTTTRLPSLEIPDLLLAHSGGITLVGPGETWFDGGPVVIAYSDLRGGVVFQRDGERPGPIESLAVAGADPAVLIGMDTGERLAILEVFPLDGAPTLAYTYGTRLPNDCDETDVECGWDYDVTYLMLLDLATGTEMNLGIVGAFESDWHAYRFAEGVYASMWSEYAEEAVCVGWGALDELIDSARSDRWLSARDRCRIGPPTNCPHDSLCSGVTRLDVAPDGRTLAFVSGSYGRQPMLVVIETATGETVRTIALPEVDVYHGWIAYDGTWVVLGRLAPDWSELPSLVVRPDGIVEELEFAGRVTFWDTGAPS